MKSKPKHDYLKEIKEVSLGFLKKYQIVFHMKDGTDFNYDLVTRNKIEKVDDLGSKINAVSIIVYDSKGYYLLLREFRYSVNDYVIDFPAGIIDKNETIIEAAIRELYEETSLSPKNIIKVMDGGFSSVGMTDERVAIVVLEVDDIKKASNEHLDGNEVIDYLYLNTKDLENLVSNSYENNLKISNRVQFYVASKF